MVCGIIEVAHIPRFARRWLRRNQRTGSVNLVADIEELYVAIQSGFDLLDKRLLLIEAMAEAIKDGGQ